MDTGRTARTRSTGLNSVARKCDTSVRKSRSEPRKERKKFCVSVYSRCCFSAQNKQGSYRVRMCMALAPVPPRLLRSVGTHWAPGSRARPVRGASWRDQPPHQHHHHHPEYRCLIVLRAGFICSLSFYFWITFRKKTQKNLEVDFWIEGGKSRVRLFTTASLCQQLGSRDNTNRFILHTFKKS